MEADRDVKNFISNNGTETSYISSSAESCAAPTEETSVSNTPYPYAKQYVTAAEAQMWTAVEMLKQLEVKLRPIYDGLIHHRSTQEKSECLEQQNRMMQTILETCKKIFTVIESKLADVHVANQPVAVPVDVEFPCLPYPDNASEVCARPHYSPKL